MNSKLLSAIATTISTEKINQLYSQSIALDPPSKSAENSVFRHFAKAAVMTGSFRVLCLPPLHTDHPFSSRSQ